MGPGDRPVRRGRGRKSALLLLLAVLWSVTASLPSTSAVFTAATATTATFSAWVPAGVVLTQPEASSSCISYTASWPCSVGAGLVGAISVAITNNGASVYVASNSDTSAGGNAVSAFARSSTDGYLAQLPGTKACVQHTDTAGACAKATLMFGTRDVAVTADRKNVYSVAVDGSSLSVLSRSPEDGALSRLSNPSGCVVQLVGTSGCTDGKAMSSAYGVTVSPDDKYVYVVSRSLGSVSILQRNLDTGVLTPTTCLRGSATDGDGAACTITSMLGSANSIAFSPDGANAYVASGDPSGYPSGAVVAFSRNSAGALTPLGGTAACVSHPGWTDPCEKGVGLWAASDVAVSPDGASVYVVSSGSNAIAVFTRNTDGSLTQLADKAGCISNDGSSNTCTTGRALQGATAVAVSPDSKQVFVASRWSGSISVFNKNATTGALTQAAGKEGCIRAGDASCTAGRALAGAMGVVVSPDGKDVYVSSFSSGAVALLTRTR
jgi:DNA-binding beta-propeller fold protein YncE